MCCLRAKFMWRTHDSLKCVVYAVGLNRPKHWKMTNLYKCLTLCHYVGDFKLARCQLRGTRWCHHGQNRETENLTKQMFNQRSSCGILWSRLLTPTLWTCFSGATVHGFVLSLPCHVDNVNRLVFLWVARIILSLFPRTIQHHQHHFLKNYSWISIWI